MDLERRLAGVENQRLDPTWALRRSQQRHGLFCNPDSVAVELERGDVFVAARPLVPAERIWIGPVLDLVRRGRRRLDPGAALEQLLFDEGPLRRGEKLRLPDELHRAFPNRDALDRAHRRVGAQEQVHLFTERHGKRITFQRRSVVPPGRDRRPQIDRRRWHAGAGPRNPDGTVDDLLDFGFVEPGAAGESPGAVDDYPDAEALAGVVGDRGQLAVLDDDVLRDVFVEAHVRVARSLDLSRVERGFSSI